MKNETEEKDLAEQVLQPEVVPSPTDPRLPSERIKAIHSRVVKHMTEKQLGELSKARLMPNAPPELAKVTPESLQAYWNASPDAHFAAILRFLDDCYMEALRAQMQMQNPQDLTSGQPN